MTDRHRPSAAVVLPRYLAEASVYVLVTSVGADCYVCILSHGAIALRCAPPSPPRPTTHNLPPATPPSFSPAPRLPPVRPPWPGPPSPLCTPVDTHPSVFKHTFSPFHSEFRLLPSRKSVKHIKKKTYNSKLKKNPVSNT